MSGKTKIKITRYTGTIHKSGKQVFKFGAYILCHRSIKADKSDFLVNTDDGMIIRAYPIGTSRNIILEDIAENLDALDRYFKHSSRYVLVDFDPKLAIKQKGSEESVVLPIQMDAYSDGSCVVPKEKEVEPQKEKRSFNMSAKEDW